MMISFLVIITKSTSNSEYFPPPSPPLKDLLGEGWGGGKCPQQKHFPCKEVLKKAKEKTIPCFTHGGNWMSCFALILGLVAY
jgi:hypothetical protein